MNGNKTCENKESLFDERDNESLEELHQYYTLKYGPILHDASRSRKSRKFSNVLRNLKSGNPRHDKASFFAFLRQYLRAKLRNIALMQLLAMDREEYWFNCGRQRILLSFCRFFLDIPPESGVYQFDADFFYSVEQIRYRYDFWRTMVAYVKRFSKDSYRQIIDLLQDAARETGTAILKMTVGEAGEKTGRGSLKHYIYAKYNQLGILPGELDSYDTNAREHQYGAEKTEEEERELALVSQDVEESVAKLIRTDLLGRSRRTGAPAEKTSHRCPSHFSEKIRQATSGIYRAHDRLRKKGYPGRRTADRIRCKRTRNR